MNPLQDPNFIVTVAVDVVTFFGIIVIPLALYRRQQNRKSISYELISDAPILQGMAAIKEAVEVRLRTNGQVVENLNQIVIKFRNSGNQTIKSDDFDVPIQVIFDEKTTVISSGYDSDISAQISFLDAKTIKLIPNSMNSKEELVIYALVAEYRGEIQYKAHIIGGTFRESRASTGTLSVRQKATLAVLGTVSGGMLANLFISGLVIYGILLALLIAGFFYLYLQDRMSAGYLV